MEKNMSRLIAFVSASLCISAPAFAGLVWQSTFDSTADGVVDARNDNPNKVMIGANTGGNQTIVTAGRKVTPSDKAGRPLGTTKGANDSFSAYYQWNYSAFEDDQENAVEEMAGFLTTSSQHSTRQFMGARIQHYIGSNGDNLVRFGGGWASEGNTGSGRYFTGTPAGDVNLGSNVIGRELQLVVAYDGVTKFLTTNLYDTDGTILKTVSQDIRLFDNLGVPPNDPALTAEMSQLTLTHLGWSDFISGVVQEKTNTWSVDTLAYYDDASGAFGQVVPEPSVALLALAASAPLCWPRRSRRQNHR
jgi:hypothetical protein